MNGTQPDVRKTTVDVDPMAYWPGKYCGSMVAISRAGRVLRMIAAENNLRMNYVQVLKEIFEVQNFYQFDHLGLSEDQIRTRIAAYAEDTRQPPSRDFVLVGEGTLITAHRPLSRAAYLDGMVGGDWPRAVYPMRQLHPTPSPSPLAGRGVVSPVLLLPAGDRREEEPVEDESAVKPARLESYFAIVEEYDYHVPLRAVAINGKIKMQACQGYGKTRKCITVEQRADGYFWDESPVTVRQISPQDAIAEARKARSRRIWGKSSTQASSNPTSGKGGNGVTWQMVKRVALVKTGDVGLFVRHCKSHLFEELFDGRVKDPRDLTKADRKALNDWLLQLDTTTLVDVEKLHTVGRMVYDDGIWEANLETGALQASKGRTRQLKYLTTAEVETWLAQLDKQMTDDQRAALKDDMDNLEARARRAFGPTNESRRLGMKGAA